MIEKWKDEDFEKNNANAWCYDIECLLKDDEEVDSVILGSLEYDSFDDELEVVVLEEKEQYSVVISLTEETHKATDNRDENISYIKAFVSQEMPYLKLVERKDHDYDGDYGFELIFTLKEVS